MLGTQRRARQAEDVDILDSVAEEAARLKAALGSPRQDPLGRIPDNVREIEQRISRQEARASRDIAMDAPQGIPEGFEEHAALMSPSHARA